MRRKKVKVIERKLGRERAMGLSWIGENTVEIDERLTGKDKFVTYIHEYWHQLFPDKTEEAVEEESQKMADFLWDNGFRKVDLK